VEAPARVSASAANAQLHLAIVWRWCSVEQVHDQAPAFVNVQCVHVASGTLFRQYPESIT
jgi:hypothetical protein